MTIAPNIKAIAWDLDGTLIDSFAIYSEIVISLAPSFGLQPPTPEMLLANFHGRLDESISAAFGGLQPETLRAYEEQFVSTQQRYYLNIDEHILADAVKLMEEASHRGLKQVIVTNRAHAGRGSASPRAIVERSILKSYVTHIICGDETGDYHKPDPEVFGDLLLKWQVKPTELVVVGDQYVDAQLALNVGASAIIVNRATEKLVHTDKLPPGWQTHVRKVKSLHEVTFAS
jgi:phosphoglycolate phosphatase-like HAD superfamily hydrolase